MLDRYQLVTWMIADAEGRRARERRLMNMHLADLRILDDRPSLLARVSARVREVFAPVSAARPEPDCCPA